MTTAAEMSGIRRMICSSSNTLQGPSNVYSAVHPVRSERESEPQLQHTRLIRDVAVERRLPIAAVAFLGHIGSVVRMVEQVEHFQDAVNTRAASESKMPLDSQVHAVNGVPDQAVARHHGAVRAPAGSDCGSRGYSVT